MACARSAHSDSLRNTPCLPHGDANMKRGSAAGLAVEADRAPVLLFNNFAGNGKTHPGAFSHRFGGKSCFERLPLLLGRHAATAIGDGNVNVALVISARAYGDRPFALDRLAGVDQQVEE